MKSCYADVTADADRKGQYIILSIDGSLANPRLPRQTKINKKKDVVFIHAGVLGQSEEYDICLDWQIR